MRLLNAYENLSNESRVSLGMPGLRILSPSSLEAL
jgi:hypothetical protein